MATRSLLIAALALVAPASFAQFDVGPGGTFQGGGGGSSSMPWKEFKLPKKTMKLDFKNANLDMVISLFSKTSGVTIVKDPALTGTVTLTTAKAVPLSEAFEILNAAVGLRNAEMVKQGNVLVIKVKPRNQQGGGWGGRGGQGMPDIGSIMQQMGGGNQETELRVYPIKLANASQVARVINDVFAQTGGGGNPFGGLQFMMGGGRGGQNFRNFGNMGSQPQIRASSDDFSNTVIVNAPRDKHQQVNGIIKEIDKVTDDPVDAKVYKLEFATSDELQPVLQNLLIANAPRGRGGSTTPTQGGGGGGFFGGFGFGQNQQQNRQQQAAVVSEPRSNSLIITTTEANQKLVASVIDELDQKIEMQSTTFVFPLENARADQVSTLLRQAFGNRSGTGNNNQGGLNRNTQNTGRTNMNNTRNQGNQGGGIRTENMEDGLPIELADPNLDAGELQTNVAVQGGFFGGFGGGGQQNNQNNQRRTTQQMGRDAQGRLVPVQDLTNQVTVIPDQNTNSLIVVTTPENAEMIRQILGQLDRIPEQVMIETIIVEASLDANSKLGVEWNFAQTPAFGNQGTSGTLGQTLSVPKTGDGFRYTLSGGNFSAVMNALQTDQKFQVLSTPRIFTSNNVEAEINISQRVPFVVSQREDANGNLTFTYDFEDVGIVLNVTPRITANGYVTMDVSQTANDLQGFTSFNAPIVNQRQAQTTVAVKDGDTIILGGIMRSTVSSTVKKVPLLGDIPILGNLFKSTDKTNTKTELLVFLTPKVVRNPDDASKLREDMQKKMSKPTQDLLKGQIGGANKTETGNTSTTGGGK